MANSSSNPNSFQLHLLPSSPSSSSSLHLSQRRRKRRSSSLLRSRLLPEPKLQPVARGTPSSSRPEPQTPEGLSQETSAAQIQPLHHHPNHLRRPSQLVPWSLQRRQRRVGDLSSGSHSHRRRRLNPHHRYHFFEHHPSHPPKQPSSRDPQASSRQAAVLVPRDVRGMERSCGGE